MADIISHSDAASIAASWGSYMSAGDPGAIFYSFPGDNTAPDWDADACKAALEYCASCMAIALQRMENPDEPHTEESEEEASEDWSKLEALNLYIQARLMALDAAWDRKEVMGEVRLMFCDDSWAETLNAWFAFAEEIHFNRPSLTVPDKFEFRPSPMGASSDPDDYMTNVATNSSDDALMYAANVMHRYAACLKRAGLSY